ncbi:MAG: hypothetical protein IKJ40_07120, partial [Bacteroidales bacterium]|nr:hypothetical protein [Bacteroidales bacterium]
IFRLLSFGCKLPASRRAARLSIISFSFDYVYFLYLYYFAKIRLKICFSAVQIAVLTTQNADLPTAVA